MLSKTERERLKKFLPGGVPRWIHAYDNQGKTADRFTVCFTGRYRNLHGNSGQFLCLGASEDPYYPTGIGYVNEYAQQVDYPKYSHLGKKVKFKDLPVDVRHFVLDVYQGIWDLPFKVLPVKEYREKELQKTLPRAVNPPKGLD